ncbi:MAG: hypothetical protein VX910_04990 [Candidatus Latescibacterota bacterium]|nr:hypothetical protein [Candidatus Latescibacterota bacterium]
MAHCKRHSTSFVQSQQFGGAQCGACEHLRLGHAGSNELRHGPRQVVLRIWHQWSMPVTWCVARIALTGQVYAILGEVPNWSRGRSPGSGHSQACSPNSDVFWRIISTIVSAAATTSAFPIDSSISCD